MGRIRQQWCSAADWLGLTLLALIPALICIAPSALWAANYGTFNGTNVTYSDVADASGLFGAPVVVGNELGFSPNTFEADCTVAPTCPPTSDLTTDTLTFEIATDAGYSISGFDLGIAGDFTFESAFGGLGAATAVANLFVDILEVDGQSINVISVARAMDFEVNGSGVIQDGALSSLSAVDGYGTHTFTGNTTLDLSAVLAANAVSGVVTRALVSFDVTLTAFAEAGSTSRIELKDADDLAFGAGIVPEPTTAALLGLGLIALASRRSGNA